ncbi:MAG TPA: AAA family ATPase [Solimonas sp.]|nr:AAA family ATPase [Solimonas sp.]
MYTEFYQLREMPFSITPDPAYLYMSPRHQEALGHLLYGTGQYGGFVQLTGEVGTGKTTIVRTLLDQKLPDVDVAMIHNPRQSEQEFVQSICDELHVDYPREQPSLKTLVDALNEHLLKAHAAGRRTVLIIDEAQNLRPEVLEQVRLLTNLETAKEKLLRIMLIGQPELSHLLARADLRQLASRITARYHLTPLSADETAEYVEHRLRVAGARLEIFSRPALAAVYRYSHGVPRLINIICDRALLGAYGQQARKVTPEIVREATRQAMGSLPGEFDPRAPQRWRWIELGWAGALLLCSAIFVKTFFIDPPPTAPAPVTPASAPAAAPRPAAPEADAVASTPPASSAPAPEPEPVLVPALPANAVSQLSGAIQPLSIAMSRLVRLWDGRLVIPRGENVCAALRQQRLQCYRSTGSWDDLARMNRPAILTLQLADSGPQYFLLRELGRNYASLDTALGPLRIARSELQTVWNGEFLLLWRSQTPETFIGPDTRGAAIGWLWQTLAEQDEAQVPSPTPETFDTRLAEALRNYQKNRGLVADGVAGIRTLIALGDDLPNTPTLVSGTTP